MKKIIIAIAIVFVAGVAAVSTQVGNQKPALNLIKINFYDYQKELASGD
jgi:hypothetical protein